MEAAKHASGHGTAVALCVDEIRRAIRVGVLMPGEHIRQSAIAESLGVSRIPIRDALSRLSADGVVAHTPNSGFKVAQLEIDELDQVYRMRELLETELLRQIPPLSAHESALSRPSIRPSATPREVATSTATTGITTSCTSSSSGWPGRA
jgi:DNA-binding GntR family transcriptional regulator